VTNDNEPSSATGERRGPGWERELLERFAFAALDEQRRTRRWKIFFRFFFAAYFLFLILLVAVDNIGPSGLSARYTAIVELDGEIGPDSLASADHIITGLRGAFEDTAAVGVVIRANSPGGSPVQSGYIYEEIKRLRKKYPEKPVYGVITDICASGCYYVLAATDKIYVDRASIVGSIGVLMNGFGFVDTMKKLGVERRLITAGDNKAILDPFSPLRPSDKAHTQLLLNAVHQQFIEKVRSGRGDRLKETKDMFSGLFWTGEQALRLGLADEFGSASFVAREVIGAEELVDYSVGEPVFDRFARRFGAAMAGTIGIKLQQAIPELR
jgi:protease IV